MKKHAKTIILLTIINIVFLHARICWAVDPYKGQNIKSPTGRYILKYTEKQKTDGDFIKTLTLIDLKNKTQKQLYSYGRGIDVVWSPQDHFLFMTDFSGSSESDVVVFKLQDNGQFSKIYISDELEKKTKIFDKGKRTIFGNSHVYIKGKKWLDNNTILINIYGWDHNFFSLWYTYNMNGAFKFIKREI